MILTLEEIHKWIKGEIRDLDEKREHFIRSDDRLFEAWKVIHNAYTYILDKTEKMMEEGKDEFIE